MKLCRRSAPRSLAAIAAAAALMVGTPPPVAESFVPPLVFPPTRSTATATATATTTLTSPTPTPPSSSLGSSLLESLPSAEELSRDSFMKQVGHGSELAVALKTLRSPTEAERASLRASLEAQLSHSDGIRGFMVAYLTGIDADGDGDGETDGANGIADETDPEILLETLHGLLASNDKGESKSSADDLVSLMCMNVVMPVAMITMHEDPALSEASRMTAARGGRLLASVFGASPSIRSNASAIRAAADGGGNGGDADPELVDYWTEFFGKWGYQEAQTRDIAATMNELLESSSSSSSSS